MLPEDESLILSASAINQSWPIVTFDPAGFSKDGKTLMELARGEKIPALVIEISQNGFNLKLAQTICDRLFYLNAEAIMAPPKKENVDYFKIVSPDGTELFCPADGIIIFPKYGHQVEVSHELGLIATLKILKK